MNASSKKYDCLIIGQGVAGTLLALELIKRNKKVLVIDQPRLSVSSSVAPGMYNPLVLKRYTLAWKAPELLEGLETYYRDIEKRISVRFLEEKRIARKFHNTKEAELWLEKSDQLSLEPFMQPNIETNQNNQIDAEFGLGFVKKTGRVNLPKLLSASRFFLKENEALEEQQFHYENLLWENDSWNYQNICAQHIIFSEGYYLSNNPYFKELPLMGTKGELMTIKAPNLQLDFTIKSGIFLMPLGEDLYRVGATFNWEEKDFVPTEKGQEELQTKLQKIIKCDFEIVSQEAGIRPTVKDRRPLLGSHQEQKNMHILNGMGTRGVMLAPKAVEMLINFILEEKELDPEWDIKRFYKC
ncbi:MAG: FAD-binding oxidoreductase [Flavobacteriales bacterium]|jgi:glycine/D-amino acid oxidase-like deaminating enzyme|nr:FAD-binding oxidoreductase [Flavobacteriales bacterium]